MEQTAIEHKIRELFATLLQVNVQDIREDTEPTHLERWDSMQHLILVSGFEEEFGIDVDPEEAVDMYASYDAFRTVILRKLENGR